MGSGVWGLGFGVWGMGFWFCFGVWGLVFGICNTKRLCNNTIFVLREHSASEFAMRILLKSSEGGILPQHARITKHTSPITNWTYFTSKKVRGLWFGVWGLGFGVWGWGLRFDFGPGSVYAYAPRTGRAP